MVGAVDADDVGGSGVELAAVQLRTLTLSQLGRRLEHRLGPLTGDRRAVPPHQQTLRGFTPDQYLAGLRALPRQSRRRP